MYGRRRLRWRESLAAMTCDHCHQPCAARYVQEKDGVELAICWWCWVGRRRGDNKPHYAKSYSLDTPAVTMGNQDPRAGGHG